MAENELLNKTKSRNKRKKHKKQPKNSRKTAEISFEVNGRFKTELEATFEMRKNEEKHAKNAISAIWKHAARRTWLNQGDSVYEFSNCKSSYFAFHRLIFRSAYDN